MLAADVHIEKLSERAWRLTPPGPGESLGLVVVQHGLGSRKERHLELALRLVNAGFAVLLTEAAFHGERKGGEESDILHAGPNHPAFLGAMETCVAETVSELQALIGEAEYGFVGHSMGGLIGLHLARTDPHLTRLVVIGGAIDTEAAFGEIGAPLSPLRRAAELTRPRITLLHGADDPLVPVAWAKSLHAALPEGAQLKIYPDVGHELTETMMHDALLGVQR
jgi:pimeloyl-ACP methyl ester carboxylesterase